MLVQAKQISKLLQAPLYVSGFAYPAAATASVTAALTAAASTAGDGASSVPVQVASATTMGFVTSGAGNRVSVWDSSTGLKLVDALNNEVYGRLTGTYDLALFSAVAGVDTSYTPAAITTIDFEVAYQFSFEKLPATALTNVEARYVGDDPVASGATSRAELLTVTALNTLSALTTAPNLTRQIKINVNGQMVSSLLSPAPFTVAGTTVTWNAVNAGFSLATTDQVVAEYTV